MHIELLWLIPVFAFAGFLFFIAFYVQRKSELQSRGADLSKEVAMFNAGQSDHGRKAVPGNQDERLRELEKAINVLSTSLSTERARQDGQKESGGGSEGKSEIGELKEKLRTVFREYDIVLSENYALRAKVKQIMKKGQMDDTKEETADLSMDSFLTRTPQTKPNLHLYGDTRLMKVIELEPDEEETNIDGFRARKH